MKENLSHYFSNIVLSGNQHVVINVVGETGSGKSSFAGGLIIGMANYMGQRLNRDPRTLFNFQDNLACINLDRVQKVMEDPKEYNIIWLDDMGIALNSRKFYTLDNMDFNDVLQSFRPNRNIVVITEPQESLIDKVIRKIAHYHIELTNKLFETHNIPMTACKAKKIQYKHIQDDTYHPFLQDENGRYVRHLTLKTPDVFLNEYDRIRGEEYKRMLTMKRQDRKEKETKANKPTNREKAIEAYRDWKAGIYERLEDACIDKDIKYSYARSLMSQMKDMGII